MFDHNANPPALPFLFHPDSLSFQKIILILKSVGFTKSAPLQSAWKAEVFNRFPLAHSCMVHVFLMPKALLFFEAHSSFKACQVSWVLFFSLSSPQFQKMIFLLFSSSLLLHVASNLIFVLQKLLALEVQFNKPFFIQGIMLRVKKTIVFWSVTLYLYISMKQISWKKRKHNQIHK